jgi:hypothetical protein
MAQTRVNLYLDDALARGLDKLCLKLGGLDRSSAIRVCIARMLEAEGIATTQRGQK